MQEFTRHQFHVMSTPAEIVLSAEPDIAELLVSESIEELERISAEMTRFDPDSPIERLNDSGGGETSGSLREVLAIALESFEATAGRFSVAVGSEMIASGYDRDFDLLEVPTADEIRDHAMRHAVWRHSTVDADLGPGFALDERGGLSIEPGRRIDVGGLAKGWAADRICGRLAPAGSCIVNLGGDMAVHVATGDEPWPIGVELARDVTAIALAHGGVATSGQDRRIWRVPGREGLAHHVIDPRTGEPSSTDMLRITVFADSCSSAEVWSKALFISGCDQAAAEARERGLNVVIVGIDGRVFATGTLASIAPAST